MPAETSTPQSFADLITSSAYPIWAKPSPIDKPTKHIKTYTFLRGLANTLDTFVDGCKTAAYAHIAKTAPADGLNALGVTYGGLTRALRDSDSSYRDYLKAPMTRWSKFGTVEGLKAELAHLGYPDAYVISWRDLVDAGAAAPNVVFGGNSSFFYVGIRAPNPIGSPVATWGGGALWRTSGALWGTSASTAEYINEIRRVIALVKPAHTSCRFICVFNDSLSGPNAQLLPSGTFHIYPCNESWERIRPSMAFNPYYISDPLVP